MMEIISLVCWSILLVVSEPVIIIRGWLGLSDEDYLATNSKIKKFIFRLITCPMCLSFWISFIYTHSLLVAPIVSITTDIVYKIILRL